MTAATVSPACTPPPRTRAQPTTRHHPPHNPPPPPPPPAKKTPPPPPPPPPPWSHCVGNIGAENETATYRCLTRATVVPRAAAVLVGGPWAERPIGSTFISRNNPDRAAKNFNLLLREAELARRDCVLWNIVPWYTTAPADISDRRPKRTLRAGLPYPAQLLPWLPRLTDIVLVRKAAGSRRACHPATVQRAAAPQCAPESKGFQTRPAKRVEALGVLPALRQQLEKKRGWASATPHELPSCSP